MYLHRFTDGIGLCMRCRSLLQLLQLLLLTLLLAGCGAIPGTRQAGVGAGAQSADTPEVPQRAQTMYEQAAAIMASGDYLEAQFRFQEFLMQYPGYPGAHVNLAIIYASNGDDQGAENSITDALMIDSQYPPALNQLGMLLRRQGRFQEAESAYLKAVMADPDYPLPHYNLGVLNELYLQQLESALLHYERYQALAENDKQVGKWIADLKRRIGSSQRTANVTE